VVATAGRYNLSFLGPTERADSPLDSPSRTGAVAAAPVVVRANPLFDMVDEDCDWWREKEEGRRVRALGLSNAR